VEAFNPMVILYVNFVYVTICIHKKLLS
jgi:hypothetical protein